ncbi:MAG TPA: 6-phosphogluconate dehydrogenase [Bacteroidia bacterium]|nr:6-phosphogluconate dehydrogenase [Bacteroidia bacterium]
MDPLQNNQHSSKNSGRFSRFFRWAALTLVLAMLAYYFICGITYSEGTRSGVLTKISKRGYVFKTYEGELNIGGLNQGDGTIMPLSIFKFSVQDDKVYLALQDAQGRKVVLFYKEVIKSFFWQGESNYFVYKATVVK